MTPGEARDRFATARIARLATADGHGVPHLVPITFALTDDEILSAVDHKPKRSTALRRLANLAANPRVAVLVDAYDEDWSRLWWARADGTAEVLHDATSLRQAQDLLRERYPQYADVPIDGPVIRIRVEAWSGWEFAAGG
jgi:PPOX class probable F420-dependent enzyme